MASGSDFTITLKVQDNSGMVMEEFRKATERALFAMGVTAVEGATDSISSTYQAVDTGRLRASISFITPEEGGTSGYTAPNSQSDDTLQGASAENTVTIGSNVEYAAFVETGTSRMAARPFLRNGIESKVSDIQRQIENIYKGAL